jgi:hypothetical protein
MKSKKLSKKRSKKRSTVSSKKRILDGVKDEKNSEGIDIKVYVKDEILGSGHYKLSVNSDDYVQTILDKFKCELVKNSKWPKNDYEYKYILKHLDGRVLQLDMLIADSGIGNETYLSLTSQKIKHHEELYSKIEQLEKKVVVLEAINWIAYFGQPLEPYYYEYNKKNVTVDVIKSALTIISKNDNPHYICYKLFLILKYMNDENLEKLIPFLIENDIGISTTSTDILKFNDPDFSNKLKKSLDPYGDKVEVFNKIQRVMAKIHKKT